VVSGAHKNIRLMKKYTESENRRACKIQKQEKPAKEVFLLLFSIIVNYTLYALLRSILALEKKCQND